MARKLARGTMLQRDDGLGAFVTVAQATTIDGPAKSAEIFSFDDHEVPLGYAIKRKTRLDGGQITVGVNFDPDDPSHELLDEDFEDLAETRTWRLVYPLSTNGFQGQAMVVGLSPSAPTDQGLSMQVTLETSGAFNLQEITP